MKRKFPLILIPMLIIMMGTVLIPVILSFKNSLYYDKLTDPSGVKFVGWKNYLTVLRDQQFHTALFNSCLVIILVTLFGLIGSLFTALLLKQRTKISSFLLALAIIPWALPPLVNGIIWKFIFLPSTGLIAKLFPGHQLNLLDHHTWYLIILALVVSWRVIPFCALVLLASLQNISPTYYQAYQLDGGNKIQAFFAITLPLLLPALSICLMNLMTASLNVFDEVVALVGYQFADQTLLVDDYQTTFNFLNFGLGSAISYLMMLLGGVIGYFYIRKMTSEVTN